jgi:adenylate kinase
MPEPVRVFVSYASSDRAFAEKLVTELQSGGAEVWWDVTGINEGDFLRKIDEALQDCDWFVLVLTPNAIASKWVKKEMYAAIHRREQNLMRGILPILAAPIQAGKIPPMWDNLHRFDATHNYELARDGMLRAIGLMLSVPLDMVPQPSTSPAQVKHSSEVIGPGRTSPAIAAGDAPSQKATRRDPPQIADSASHPRLDSKEALSPKVKDSTSQAGSGGSTQRKQRNRATTANMNIILIGAQGSGKGTQAELLSREFDLKSLASDWLLHDAMERKTPSGQKARSYYDRGDLVPDDIIVGMIVEHLDELDGKRGIVLDGFPRTNAQASALDVALVQREQQVNWAINLDAPREMLVERLSGRYLCKAHGHVWNIRTRPPKTPRVCDMDGSPLYQRIDDTGEAVQKRLDFFFKETIHLVEYYEARGKLIRIDATKSIQEVNEAIFAALRRMGVVPVMAAQTDRTVGQ